MFPKIALSLVRYKNSHLQVLRLCLGLALLLTLAACSGDLPGRPTETSTATEPPAVTATVTPMPTDTPQPPLVIFWAAEGADVQMASALQDELAGLTGQAGLRFQTLNSPLTSDLVQQAQIVVAISPGAELQALASSASGTQFLVIAGDPSLTTGHNLTLLGKQGTRLDQLGFLAGYLAAVITQDWRVGVISQAGSGPEAAAQAGFINVAVFFCGLCRPAYPPFVQYPAYVELAAGSGQAEGQSAVDTLISQGVETVYVTPGATNEALLGYLAEKGIHIIGSSPPSQAVQDNWVATVMMDWASAVRNVWPSLLNGEGGQTLSVPIKVADANPTLFSPGRQQLVAETLTELLAGRIATGIDPQTGERTP
jgi:basic membrane lipoprotein Med (substrate-binding protein (PBP1-ABC) superfamily)